MKIYTKTGDDGETGLYGKGRVSKDSVRIECIGKVDELNALLGWVKCATSDFEFDLGLYKLQNDLFDLGARIASADADKAVTTWDIDQSINHLEEQIDAMDDQLPALKHFILPGGHELAARIHVARCKCREAERRIVALSHEMDMKKEIVFLNRLGDWLFVAARFVNHCMEFNEPKWTPDL